MLYGEEDRSEASQGKARARGPCVWCPVGKGDRQPRGTLRPLPCSLRKS